MQVEHHVSVAGQPLQGQALGLQRGGGIQTRQGTVQAGAHQVGIVLRIVIQVRFDVVTDFIAQVEKITVEVLAALQFVAPQGDVHQHLLQARRVGDGYQHDFAAQQALSLQGCQTLLEMPGHEHARQLVGMQRGLDIDLAGALWAKVEAVDLSGNTRYGGE
ncbi:hypothetical protein D3C80_881890 [compost metagenome]